MSRDVAVMSPRARHALLSEAEIWQEGPPIKVRDLAAIIGESPQTIRRDILRGRLRGGRKRHCEKTPYLIQRVDARAYLVAIGFQRHVS